MATDLKVDELGSPLTPLVGDELVYVVDGSEDHQTTTQDIADLAGVPAGVVSYVGSAVVPGNLAAFAATDGTEVEDSGFAASDFATAAQGTLADSAVQYVGSAVAPGNIAVFAASDGQTVENSNYTVQDIIDLVGSGGGGGAAVNMLTIQSFI